MKIIKNIITIFLVVMLITSCTAEQVTTIPFDATFKSGFEYGIFNAFIVFPMGMLINFLSETLGNAGLAMIITTVIARSISLPVTIKGQIAMKKQQALQPKMAALEEKYRGRDDQASKQKKAMEMQQMYKDEGVSIGGMFYSFLTLPVFMGVWRATTASEAITQSGGTFLGFSLGEAPGAMITSGQYYYILLVVVVAVTQYGQMKVSSNLTSKRSGNDKSRKTAQQSAMEKQMKMMPYIFTVMMVFMSLSLTAAMSIYLATSAIVSISQAYYIDKIMKEA